MCYITTTMDDQPLISIVNVAITPLPLHARTNLRQRFQDKVLSHFIVLSNSSKQCKECTWSSVGHSRHWITIHTDPTHTCEFCDKTFYFRCDYEKHLNAHK